MERAWSWLGGVGALHRRCRPRSGLSASACSSASTSQLCAFVCTRVCVYVCTLRPSVCWCIDLSAPYPSMSHLRGLMKCSGRCCPAPSPHQFIHIRRDTGGALPTGESSPCAAHFALIPTPAWVSRTLALRSGALACAAWLQASGLCWWEQGPSFLGSSGLWPSALGCTHVSFHLAPAPVCRFTGPRLDLGSVSDVTSPGPESPLT